MKELLLKAYSGKREFSQICEAIGTKEVLASTFLNPYSIQKFGDDLSLIDSFDHVFCDGFLLAKIRGFLFGLKTSPLSFDMSSLAKQAFSYISRNDHGLAVVGGQDSELSLAKQSFLSQFETMRITFSSNGYFSSPQEFEAAISAIYESKADVLIVGMGTPLQEKFAAQVKQHFLRNGRGLIIFTCGGFISQSSISPFYYPDWVVKMNLRWFYRFLREPHVRARLLRDYPLFIIKVLRIRLQLFKTN